MARCAARRSTVGRGWRGVVMTLTLLILATNSTALAATGSESPDRVGTYPAWLSAALTGLAFLITATIFHRDRRDRIRDQAQLVYAWEDRDVEADGSLLVKASVVNKSEAPIWDVQILPRKHGKEFHAASVTRVGDVAIKPGESADWTWRIGPADASAMDRQPLLVFTDAANRSWRKVGSRLAKTRV